MTGTTVDESGYLALLRRGGLAADAPIADEDLAIYNGLLDPPGVEVLGAELAHRARHADATVVLIWEHPEDVALGHVVGRELGLPVVRAYDADGLVGTTAGLAEGARILLVADAVRDAHVVRAARALASRLGGRLMATAVLVGTAALAEVADQAGDTVALVQLPAAEPAASAD